MSRLRQLLEEYAHRATEVRAVARAGPRRGSENHAGPPLYNGDVVLPLHAAIVAESQMQYNAMQNHPVHPCCWPSRRKSGPERITTLHCSITGWLAASLSSLLDGTFPNLAVRPGMGGGAGMMMGTGPGELAIMQGRRGLGGAGGQH